MWASPKPFWAAKPLLRLWCEDIPSHNVDDSSFTSSFPPSTVLCFEFTSPHKVFDTFFEVRNFCSLLCSVVSRNPCSSSFSRQHDMTCVAIAQVSQYRTARFVDRILPLPLRHPSASSLSSPPSAFTITIASSEKVGPLLKVDMRGSTSA